MPPMPGAESPVTEKANRAGGHQRIGVNVSCVFNFFCSFVDLAFPCSFAVETEEEEAFVGNVLKCYGEAGSRILNTVSRVFSSLLELFDCVLLVCVL